jgi:maltose-binding protein MalE
VPEWGRVGDAMNYALDLVYSGENTDAQAVLDEANDTIQGILDEYWANQ